MSHRLIYSSAGNRSFLILAKGNRPNNDELAAYLTNCVREHKCTEIGVMLPEAGGEATVEVNPSAWDWWSIIETK